MRARIALGAALLLSLCVKAAWAREAPPIDSSAFDAQAERLLRSSGFEVRLERQRFGTVVHGRSGACVVLVADYPPHGTLRQVLGIAARGVAPLRYAWRGGVSEDAPKLLPLLDFYVWREASRLGLRPPRHPITAVAMSPGCPPSRIDWTGLASV